MSIRTKLTLAMGSLIVVIMFCLLAVTRVQFYILRDFAYAQDRPRFLALEQEFERFYQGNGRSWEKVDTADFPQAVFFPEMLLKTDEGVELHKGTVPLSGMYNDGFPLIMEEDGHRIGILFVMNERQIRIYELKEMWYDILPNILKVSLGVTFVAALIIIFFLTRRLTRPIRRILNGINAIERGEPDGKLPIARRDEFGAIALALHRMNENWSRAEASRKQLLSDVAHELRTP
ncbi:HAMP domain-containing protein [Paenibacillus sp. CC-CFT747]|nr:HAMP domain-containing protein [Paenibacillus sp. CC-CFT747]